MPDAEGNVKGISVPADAWERVFGEPKTQTTIAGGGGFDSSGREWVYVDGERVYVQAPCPCGEPSPKGYQPCSFAKPCPYGEGHPRERWGA